MQFTDLMQRCSCKIYLYTGCIVFKNNRIAACVNKGGASILNL
jgi:hypothetical protein